MASQDADVVRAADVAEPVTVDLEQAIEEATAATATAAAAPSLLVPASEPTSRAPSPQVPPVPAISLDVPPAGEEEQRTEAPAATLAGTAGALATGESTALVELEPLADGAEHALPATELGKREDGAQVDVIKDAKGRFFRRILHSARSNPAATSSASSQAGPTRNKRPRKHGAQVTYGLGHSRGAPVIVRVGQGGYPSYEPSHRHRHHRQQAQTATPPRHHGSESAPISRVGSRKDVTSNTGAYSSGDATPALEEGKGTSLHSGNGPSSSHHQHHRQRQHAQRAVVAPIGISRANPLSGIMGTANPNWHPYSSRPSRPPSAAGGMTSERRSYEPSLAAVQPGPATMAGAAGPTLAVNADLLLALREIIRDEVRGASSAGFIKGDPVDALPAQPMTDPRTTDSHEHTLTPDEGLTKGERLQNSIVAECGPGQGTQPSKTDTSPHGHLDEKGQALDTPNDVPTPSSKPALPCADPSFAGSSTTVSSAAPTSSTTTTTSTSSEDDELDFPNPWARIRYAMREPFAEFLGTCILIIFGNGINNQVFVSQLYDPSAPKGDYLSVSFGWGIGVAFGVWVGGGVSGAHLNPAVTLALAIYRGFPWRKVPSYVVAQILGALMGALLIYGLYVNPLRVVDPDQTEATASLFTTYPASFLRQPSTRPTAFYNEVLATAVLLIIILAIGDAANTPPPDGLAPLALLWAIVGIGATLGWQTAYCVNPARDLGPRIMLAIVGYAPDLLWSFDAYYVLWTPILATLVGAIAGGFIYDALIYTGSESPLNARWKWSDVRWTPHSKSKLPAATSA